MFLVFCYSAGSGCRGVGPIELEGQQYPLLANIHLYVSYVSRLSSNYASLISRCPLPVLGGLLHSVRSNEGKADENNKYCPLIIVSRAVPPPPYWRRVFYQFGSGSAKRAVTPGRL